MRGVFSRRLLIAAAFALVMLALSACAPFVDPGQPRVDPELETYLLPAHTLGQTFVSKHGGLAGVEVFLRPQGCAGEGNLVLHLRLSPDDASDLATVSLPMSSLSGPGFYRFTFKPLRQSNGRYLYFLLELTGVSEECRIGVGGGPGEAFYDGGAYRDHQPEDAYHLAFHLLYEPMYMALDLGRGAVTGLMVILLTFFLYCVPGLALLAWLLPEGEADWRERLFLAPGVGLSLYIVLLAWARVIGVRLGGWAVWGTTGAALLAWGWRCIPSLKLAFAKGKTRPRLLGWWRWEDLALGGVLVAIITGRLLIIRGLEVPLWDDSLQHAMIAQLLVDHGGIPESWLPYAPYRTFSAHYGFHTAVAVFAWATGMAVPQATLIVGQVINFLAVLALYPLAVRLGKSRWAGVVAVAVAGLFSKHPAYYVNWGRYPQLAGQMILPGAIWLFWTYADRKRFSAKAALVTALSLVGMTLGYYRMPYNWLAFFGGWFVAFYLPRYWKQPKHPMRHWAEFGGRVVLVAVLAAIMVLPWAFNMSSRLSAGLGGGAGGGSKSTDIVSVWQSLWFSVPAATLAVVALGTLWGMARQSRRVLLPVAWSLVLILLPATQALRWPGTAIMQEYAFQIGMYIPLSLIWGVIGGDLLEYMAGRRAWRAALLAGILLVIFVGRIPAQLKVLDMDFALVTPPDMRAMDWIREHIPPDARFLINGIIYTDRVSVVGGDGGWWIPLLARREVTIPPQYALLGEKPIEKGYSQAVNSLVKQLYQTPATTQEGKRLLCTHGITHVYIGQRQGMVDAALPFPPERPMLSAAALAADDDFQVLYHRDRVWIFAFNREICQTHQE